MKKTIQKSNRIDKDLDDLYKTKFFRLFVDVYGTDIILYCGKEEDLIQSVKSYLKGKYKKDGDVVIQKLQNYIGSDDNTSPYWCMQVDDLKHHKIIFICCEGIDVDEVDGICTLSHECLHAAIYIHNFHNIKDDNCGFESLVYLHEYILEQFLRTLYKNRRKDKNDNKTSS